MNDRGEKHTEAYGRTARASNFHGFPQHQHYRTLNVPQAAEGRKIRQLTSVPLSMTQCEALSDEYEFDKISL
jgi:hypothetical protein